LTVNRIFHYFIARRFIAVPLHIALFFFIFARPMLMNSNVFLSSVVHALYDLGGMIPQPLHGRVTIPAMVATILFAVNTPACSHTCLLVICAARFI
jgi:hypothetical protein